MKIALLLAAVSLAACLAQAAERKPTATPRAKANASPTIAGEMNETLDRTFPVGTPRATQEAATRKTKKVTTPNSLDRSKVGMKSKTPAKKPAEPDELSTTPTR